MLADTLEVMGTSEGGTEGLELMVLVWGDAFHSVGGIGAEEPHPIVKGAMWGNVGFETVPFGEEVH